MARVVVMKLKILNSVIVALPVYVMHDFLGLEVSSNMPFHNKSVFSYIVPPRVRMLGGIDPNIPIMVSVLTANPIWMFASRNLRNFFAAVPSLTPFLKLCVRLVPFLKPALFRTRYGFVTLHESAFFISHRSDYNAD